MDSQEGLDDKAELFSGSTIPIQSC